jgi:hypothetical protein
LWDVRDFRWTTYADAAANIKPFGRDCDDHHFAGGAGGPGAHIFQGFLYLRIGPDDLPGTFNSTVTWMLEPQ